MINDVDGKQCRWIQKELVGHCKIYPYAVSDCSDKEEVEGIFAEVKGDHGRLDILVNNGTIIRNALVTKMTEEDRHAVLNVNPKSSAVQVRSSALFFLRVCGGNL